MHIYVYRGGTLARLGHNHVDDVSKSLSGRVWIASDVRALRLRACRFPSRRLIVDDPEARRAAGSEFPPEIPPADKDGTRKNMLRAEVLDAEHYPRGHAAIGDASPASLQAPQVTARITIRDASRDVRFRPSIEREGDRLTASGEFDILQTDFGIKPFSVGARRTRSAGPPARAFSLVAARARSRRGAERSRRYS